MPSWNGRVNVDHHFHRSKKPDAARTVVVKIWNRELEENDCRPTGLSSAKAFDRATNNQTRNLGELFAECFNLICICRRTAKSGIE